LEVLAGISGRWRFEEPIPNQLQQELPDGILDRLFNNQQPTTNTINDSMPIAVAVEVVAKYLFQQPRCD
jgi:hypothetical protein